MKFKYSVIGDNTVDNIKHLEKIGYCFEETNKRFTPYVYANGNCVFFASESFALAILVDPKEEYVSCIGNDSLFRAVSAMRDDYSPVHTNDFMQWFVADNDWLLWDKKAPQSSPYWREESEECGVWDDSFNGFIAYNPYRKATLEELKIYFAKKIYEPKCVCATCGSRYSNDDTAFCENGHDDWLEPQDSIDIF